MSLARGAGSGAGNNLQRASRCSGIPAARSSAAVAGHAEKSNGAAGAVYSDRVIRLNWFEAQQERRQLPDTDSTDAAECLHQGVGRAAVAIQRQ